METSILEEVSAIIKASDWIIKNIRCTNEYKIAIAELLSIKTSLPKLSICKDNIPSLTENTLYCATDLLKYYHVNISTAEFNKIMMDINMMKEVNGKVRTKILINKGLNFGENVPTKSNIHNTTRPMYYSDNFLELLKITGING